MENEREYFPEVATWDLANWEAGDGRYDLVHVMADGSRAVIAKIEVTGKGLSAQDACYVAEFMAAAPRLWRQLRNVTPWATGAVDFPEATREVADATAVLAEVSGNWPWQDMRPVKWNEVATAAANDALVGPGQRRHRAPRRRRPAARKAKAK